MRYRRAVSHHAHPLLLAARRLDLSGQPLTEPRRRALVDLLEGSPPQLRALSLRACQLDDARLRALAPALLTATALVELDLGENPISDASADALRQLVREHPGLRALQLDGTTLSDAGARVIVDALPGSRLVRMSTPRGLSPALARRKVALLCANRNRDADDVPAPARPRPRPRATPSGDRYDTAPARPGDDALEAAAATLRALLREPGELQTPTRAASHELRRAIAAAARLLRRQPVAPARPAAPRRARQRARDAALVASAELRTRGAAPPPTPALGSPEGHVQSHDELGPDDARALSRARRCYVCKQPYRQLHMFYDRLCPPCARLNFERRTRAADLRGRVALLTGGRTKTGYAVALKLLRAGATVIATTRFPRDAARRYAREADFEEFRARLQLYRLDLIDVPRVEALCAHLDRSLPRLDILINLAAQTVYKPPAYHARVAALERQPPSSVPPKQRALLRALPGDPEQSAIELPAPAQPSARALARAGDDPRLGARWRAARDDDPELFPRDPRDPDPLAEPLDLRSANSWRLKLEEIGAVELLEVLLINISAPFILCSRLRGALARGPRRPSFIINVSAPEGQFYRAYKGPYHPHANMSKAALNMLTRTAADDYARDRVYMNSVDPGWISNDNPRPIAERMAAAGFHPPIDVIDAAARVCDPIFEGVDDESRCVFGQFLKDYKPAPW